MGPRPTLLRPMLCALTLALLAPAGGSLASDDGFHTRPHLGYSSGDHQVDQRLELRYRWENWDAFVDNWEDFHGLRTRVALDYRYRDRVRLFAQAQHTSVLGLDPKSSGVAGLYRQNNGSGDPSSVRLSQLFVELGVTDDVSLRLGRSYVNMGTLVPYEEANWKFLKTQRLSQRLLGTLEWTNGARAYDGGTVHAVLDGHHLHAFALEPTTGVFVVDTDAYSTQKTDILVAGLDWTASRGTLLENTELGGFFVSYLDDRDSDDVSGLFGEIEVYTLGGSWLGVYPLGPGRVDTTLWGAFQFGDYKDQGETRGTRTLNQVAGALVAEAGYQLPDVWSAPWLRFGVNYASGDNDRDDSKRNTFFNVLPTNHLYYGYLDQFAFQNLVDLITQLRLAPTPRLTLDVTYHRFWLPESNDFRWVGSGAFSRQNLGFTSTGSSGSNDAGHELDLTAILKLHRTTTLMVGFSRLWGGSVFNGQADDDASFGYVQIAIRY